jgi:glycosyltransferase involved in cell wall biosynthesis
MVVVHISCGEARGGAPISAYRLHRGLRRIGVESRMLVKQKFTTDESVERARGSNPTILQRVRRRLRDEAIAWSFRQYRGKVESFSDDRAADTDFLPSSLPNADIYNLHWVAGFLDSPSFFKNVARGKTLVWTLHAMEAFTGGCYYAGSCKGFLEACGECPELTSQNRSDLSASIFRRKRAAYANLSPENFRVVTPSDWLRREALRSALFRNFEVTTIPYGLDTEVFQPRCRATAREIFGIPQDVPIVAFVGSPYQTNRKGLDLLVRALNSLGERTRIGLMSIGDVQLPEPVVGDYFAIGELRNERLLSFAYSAAELFACPSREDNLPNAVLEAMACGTPVVAFDIGGIPDMVRSGKTGFLVPPQDVRALRDAIEVLLSDEEKRIGFARESRCVAVADYGLEVQARRYQQLYVDFLRAGRRHTSVSKPRLELLSDK